MQIEGREILQTFSIEDEGRLEKNYLSKLRRSSTAHLLMIVKLTC